MGNSKHFRRTALFVLLGTAPLWALPQGQQNSAPASQPDQSAPPPQAPATPAPQTKKHTTADDNPFPEDISRKAASETEAPAPDKAAAPPASPESDSSSSRSKFENIPEMPGDESPVSNGAGGYVLNPKLASEDVRVGGFYLDRHDYQGAYARFKEATQVNPENADAVFGLAEAARGLNHKDEAVANYRTYLDAFPDGKKAKDSRKALAALGAPPTPAK
jgi:tetratricopeptide (TPR) repeat protein